MGRKKISVKVKEIKSNIKEVSKSSKNKDSKLEDEVSSDELPSESSVQSNSSRSISPLIRSSNVAQELPSQSTSINQSSNEQVFTSTRLYSSSSETVQQRSSYITPEQAARRFNPSIVSSSPSVDVERSGINFADNDLNQSRGVSSRNYNKPLDLKQEEKKKKMPWEI